MPGAKTATADLNLPAATTCWPMPPHSRDPAAVPRRRRRSGHGRLGGSLPSTPATVTAANPAKDKFKWEISGLKTGENKITFNSKGKEAVHLIIAVPVKGKAPPLSQIEEDLASNGPPPSYVDVNEAQPTAILDGGVSQTTTLDLKKPGQYIFFCPLSDRDGGKPHFEEGLLKVETVK